MKNKRHAPSLSHFQFPCGEQNTALQLSLFPSQIKGASQYLAIEPVPPERRITPNQERYQLVLKPSGVRISPIQLFGNEVDLVAKSTRCWKWRMNSEGKLEGYVAHQLENLLIQVIEGEAI